MLLTEEEAKTKWCHRTMGYDADTEHGCPMAEKCVASMCMAWRWSFCDEDPRSSSPSYGYCGLAGKTD